MNTNVVQWLWLISSVTFCRIQIEVEWVLSFVSLWFFDVSDGVVSIQKSSSTLNIEWYFKITSECLQPSAVIQLNWNKNRVSKSSNEMTSLGSCLEKCCKAFFFQLQLICIFKWTWHSLFAFGIILFVNIRLDFFMLGPWAVSPPPPPPLWAKTLCWNVWSSFLSLRFQLPFLFEASVSELGLRSLTGLRLHYLTPAWWQQAELTSAAFVPSTLANSLFTAAVWQQPSLTWTL